MDNQQNSEILKYIPADPISKKCTKKKISYILDILFDFLQICITSCPIWVKIVKNCFKISPKKCIGGQLALVTGGANGLGREIALRLAKEGCNVIIFDIDGEAAEKTANDIKSLGVKSNSYKINVTDLKAMKQLNKEIEEEFGPVDILVNNAGVSLPDVNLFESNAEEIDHILNVNIKSHIWTVRVFMENMIRRRRGHIVAINSICGLDAMVNIIYTTTKFALRGFMECLRELIREKKLENQIFTTSVYPSFLNNRKDFVEKLNLLGWISRITPYSIELAADEIVHGILKNKEIIYIPWYCNLINLLKICIPLKIKQIIIDTLLGKK